MNPSLPERPGRDVTLSAPKSVSLMAMVGGGERIVVAHDKAVTAALGWIEKNAVLTRMQDPATRAMVHADGQKTVAATFRHDTSRNLDPQLHTHAVVANMVQDDAGKWRTMVNDGLYRNKMAVGAIYRGELAQGLGASAADPGRQQRQPGDDHPGHRGGGAAGQAARSRPGDDGPACRLELDKACRGRAAAGGRRRSGCPGRQRADTGRVCKGLVRHRKPGKAEASRGDPPGAGAAGSG